MKKLLLFLAALFTGGLAMLAMFVVATILLVRRIPSDWRERAGQLPRALTGRVLEHMPDERPWQEIVSGMSHLQEQNQQILSLLRGRFRAEETPSSESSSAGTAPD